MALAFLPSPLPSTLGDQVTEGRARISAGELAIVCSRYDIGQVRSVTPIKAGSRASPKALLTTSTGVFLLKRRAAPPSGTTPADWLHRVALSHQIVLHLAARDLPVPALLGTRDDHNSMLQLDEHVYELYRFVHGRAYDRTPDSARTAGRLLARCHSALREIHPSWPPPRRSYHAHARLPAVLRSLHTLLNDPALLVTATDLADRYDRASAAANAAGLPLQPDQLIHGDWHPGNLLWTQPSPPSPPSEVAAILDFDTVSLAPALTDAANGALQFALRRRPIDPPLPPTKAPFSVAFDLGLFGAFWAGYRDAEPVATLSWPAAAIPFLCIEAIIAEVALPIAATGRFGRFAAPGVLRLVARTAAWFETHQESLVTRATNP